METQKGGGLKDAMFIGFGILSAGFGLKGFLLSSHFIDGGVTGISMLLANIFGWPLSLSIPIINLPFIAAGYWLVGRAFAAKSALAMGGLTICLAVVPYPDVTHDLLLTAVFGGDFLVSGIEQYTGVTIVSDQSEEIRRVITEELRRGVTLYRGKRGFGKRGERNEDSDIVFTVVTRLELPKLRSAIDRVDPRAFVIQHGIDDAAGGMLKRRPLH